MLSTAIHQICIYNLKRFTILSNDYLKKDTIAFYNTDYVKFGEPNNPDYINILKNQFNDNSSVKLREAQNMLTDCLSQDLPKLFEIYGRLTICVVPRAKALKVYNEDQRLFQTTIQQYAENHKDMFDDGTDYIIRHTNTKTTHLKNMLNNEGSMPYVGITQQTCTISDKVKGRSILLIDDIYTKSVNIDEDAIQCLYNNGAEKVIFYSPGRTKSKEKILYQESLTEEDAKELLSGALYNKNGRLYTCYKNVWYNFDTDLKRFITDGNVLHYDELLTFFPKGLKIEVRQRDNTQYKYSIGDNNKPIFDSNTVWLWVIPIDNNYPFKNGWTENAKQQ